MSRFQVSGVGFQQLHFLPTFWNYSKNDFFSSIIVFLAFKSVFWTRLVLTPETVNVLIYGKANYI